MNRVVPDFDSTADRPCLSCKGEGTYTSNGFTSLEGKVYPTEVRRCISCDGGKTYPAPDYKSVMLACIATKGKNKGGLRASPPADPYGPGRLLSERRAYYVWRLARFHGGRDVTMPMTAEMVCRGDAFLPELDALAELVARKTCGTDMAAAYRWAGLVGPDVARPAGLPATAYQGGPVADGDKPDFEAPELS